MLKFVESRNKLYGKLKNNNYIKGIVVYIMYTIVRWNHKKQKKETILNYHQRANVFRFIFKVEKR